MSAPKPKVKRDSRLRDFGKLGYWALRWTGGHAGRRGQMRAVTDARTDTLTYRHTDIRHETSIGP
jgi:hypothetical protein